MSNNPVNEQPVSAAPPAVHAPQTVGRQKEVEQLYRHAIEAAGAVAYVLDYETDTYTFISAGIQAMTGYSQEEMTPALWRSLHEEIVLGDMAGGFSLEEARQMARTGEIQRWQGDYLINTRNGNRRWITNTAVIEVDDEGRTQSIGILIDITERKSTEATLARQAADYQETTDFLDTLLENLPIMLFVKEAEELRFVRWNQGAEEITGYDEETMVGKNDYDFFPPDEADHFITHDRHVLASGERLDIPVEPIETKDRGIRLLFTRKVPIYDEAGKPKFLLGISEDITGQEQARIEREALEERYRQAIEAAGAVAYSLDYTTDTYTFIGAGIKEMTGYSAAEITPSLWRSLHRDTILGEEAAGLTLEEARRMARAGRLQRWQGDYRIETRSGQSRWITNAAVILVDDDEKAVRSIGILIDITERKEAEEALAQQAAELRALNRRLTRQGWDDFLMAELTDVQFAFDLPVEETQRQRPGIANGILAQPLAVRGEPIGQLMVNEPQELPEEAAEIVAEVAERLSAHLENLRLTRQTENALAKTEAQAERLAHLSTFGAALNAMTQLQEIFDLLATRAGDIITHDHLSLALLNRTRSALDLYAVQGAEEVYRLDHSIPLTGTLAGEVVNTGRLKHISDLSTGAYRDLHPIQEEGIQEVISAPLVAGGLTLGAISFGRRTTPSFDEQDENLVQQIASLMATAIESQRLLAQAQARAERERRVRAAVDRVRQASDQQDILQVAREELGRMLGAKQAVVKLHDAGEEQTDRPLPNTLSPDGNE